MVEMPGEIILPMHDVDPDAGPGDFAGRLDAALARRPRVLVLDMTEIEQVSSTTVAMLLWARRLCAAHGVGVIVGQPSRRCRYALDRAGLLRLVPEATTDRTVGAAT